MNNSADSHDWRINLLLTASVIATVLMAALLAQLDGLQIRLQPTPLAAMRGTAVISTLTPLPVIDMPDASPTTHPTATQTAFTATPIRAASSLLPTTRCGEIPPGWSIYLVQPGDSLLSLAAISGATVAEINRVNCLQNGLVVSGMRIYLPVRPPTAVPCGPPSWWVQVRVQPGDTLFRLALRHGTTIYAIMQANCLNSTNLTAGRLLFLPPLAATPIRPLPTVTPSPTASATASATATGTASPTATAVFTATATATPSPTAVFTVTLTATPPVTATNTPPVVTPTPTATPSQIPPTNSPTPTSTPPPINTPTATPPPATATATPLPTNTVAPTATTTGG